MKIVFVGMHNKPGWEPLASATVTGRIVDIIRDGMPCFCIKTNLCDTEYLPNDAEAKTEAEAWYQKVSLSDDDVIVLLGAWTQKHFIRKGHTVIDIGHPSGAVRSGKREEYIKKSIDKILIEINHENS